jgi:hypothetical protein
MTTSKWAASIASLAVVAAILAGLYLTGSPREQRLLKLDERRVNDLMRLATSVSFYRQRYAKMPENLAVLVDGQLLRSLPLDPVTREAYRMQLTEEAGYRLCAKFARPSIKKYGQDFWQHSSGLHCFDLSAAADKNGSMGQSIMPFNRFAR